MTDEARTAVVLAAAGGGTRFGGPKQFLTLAGQPLLHGSLGIFAAVEEIAQVVVVAPATDLERTRELVETWSSAGGDSRRRARLVVEVVEGGARRQDSVLAGLETLSSRVEWVLVHDAARPLVRVGDVRRVLEAVRTHGAAVLGTPCVDSIKRVQDGQIVEELPRDEVWTVQTPQGARLELLRAAYKQFPDDSWTDEASALRRLGVAVELVEGPRENLKITRPGDEALAEFLLRSRRGEVL